MELIHQRLAGLEAFGAGHRLAGLVPHDGIAALEHRGRTGGLETLPKREQTMRFELHALFGRGGGEPRADSAERLAPVLDRRPKRGPKAIAEVIEAQMVRLDHRGRREQAEPAPAPEARTQTAPVTEAAPRELLPKDRIAIGPAKITSCRDEAGKAVRSCGTLEVDALIHPTLLALTGCPAASGAFGTLSLGFELDLVKNKLAGVQSGRSTDLPASFTVTDWNALRW